MKTRHRIAHLTHELSKLELTPPPTWGTVVRDFESGRAAVGAAQAHLRIAQARLDAGDEVGALERLVKAQADYISALKLGGNLWERPDTGGRPSSAYLDQRLRDAVDNGPAEGSLIARCRAAIAADPVLFSAFATKSDNAVRKAYRRKKRE